MKSPLRITPNAQPGELGLSHSLNNSSTLSLRLTACAIATGTSKPINAAAIIAFFIYPSALYCLLSTYQKRVSAAKQTWHQSNGAHTFSSLEAHYRLACHFPFPL